MNRLFDYLRTILQDNGVTVTKDPEYAPFRKGDVLHSQADVGKAVRELGYAPAFRIHDGLEAAIPWYVARSGKRNPVNFLNTLGTRFRAADPHHLAILKGMLTVAVFTLVGKLMSAAKEMVVAYRYGISAEVDAYHFLYNLISWPVGIWCSVLTAVLVPLAARMRESASDELPHFRSELFGFTLLLGGGLALLAWLGIRTMLALGGNRIAGQFGATGQRRTSWFDPPASIGNAGGAAVGVDARRRSTREYLVGQHPDVFYCCDNFGISQRGYCTARLGNGCRLRLSFIGAPGPHGAPVRA